jgi:hypothetical protein
LIYAIDKINYYICLRKDRLGYAGVFVFDSAVTKIDFVKLILVKSLNIKWFMLRLRIHVKVS